MSFGKIGITGREMKPLWLLDAIKEYVRNPTDTGVQKQLYTVMRKYAIPQIRRLHDIYFQLDSKSKVFYEESEDTIPGGKPSLLKTKVIHNQRVESLYDLVFTLLAKKKRKWSKTSAEMTALEYVVDEYPKKRREKLERLKKQELDEIVQGRNFGDLSQNEKDKYHAIEEKYRGWINADPKPERFLFRNRGSAMIQLLNEELDRIRKEEKEEREDWEGESLLNLSRKLQENVKKALQKWEPKVRTSTELKPVLPEWVNPKYRGKKEISPLELKEEYQEIVSLPLKNQELVKEKSVSPLTVDELYFSISDVRTTPKQIRKALEVANGPLNRWEITRILQRLCNLLCEPLCSPEDREEIVSANQPVELLRSKAAAPDSGLIWKDEMVLVAQLLSNLDENKRKHENKQKLCQLLKLEFENSGGGHKENLFKKLAPEFGVSEQTLRDWWDEIGESIDKLCREKGISYPAFIKIFWELINLSD